MDTAAAAAAAVAVDLKPDQQLLGSSSSSSTKSRIGGGGSTGCDCLGSTVETMSLTPPPTPPSRASDNHIEPGVPSAPPNGQIETHPLNGLKAKEPAETTATASTEPTQSDLPATSSTSSAKASTKPTSALLGSVSGSGSVSALVLPATDHPPAAASPVPSSSSSPASGSEENVVQLLPWQDMPTYLQFNPYVLRGYRPLQTFKGCLLSLFYWHNETINILTHGECHLLLCSAATSSSPSSSSSAHLSPSLAHLSTHPRLAARNNHGQSQVEAHVNRLGRHF